MNFYGQKITVSSNATQRIEIFPDRKRSKRGDRRFLAKWGSKFRYVPCAYQTSQGLIVHPKIYAELKRQRTQSGGDV